MADQFKLKAFVRIDGSGKVIPGGPILQAEKPKVGKWREINVKECCNYEPTTTTTTSSTSTSTSTTTTTTTSAPIDVIVDVYTIADSACDTLLTSNANITTSTPVIVGKWYTPSYTSMLAYNIISLGGSGGAIETLVNERDTCNTFTDDITWSDTACSSPDGQFVVTGNGTTFCNSTVLIAPEFESLSVGSHIVTTFEGQTYTVSTNGSIFATVTSACTSC